MNTRWLLGVFFVFLLPIMARESVRGQIPRAISYQGVLTDAEGKPLDGQFALTFKLYQTATGGSPLWEEAQQVEVKNGLFNVILGKTTPLQLPFDMPYWLGITVNSGTELQPRIQLTASAYSLNARTVAENSVSTTQIQDGAVTAAKIANGQVVKSINNLKDHVTLVAGSHVAIRSIGDTLTISASGGGGDGHSLDAADGDPVDAVFVDNQGKVGVGTTSPEGLLSIVFNTNNSDNFDPDDGLPSGLSLNNLNTTTDSYVPLYFIHGDSPSNDLDIGAAITSRLKKVSVGRVNSNIEFWTRNGDNPAMTLSMLIQSNGNVGIGTTSPKSLLHVFKNTDNAEIRITGQDNTAGKGPILSLMEYHPSQEYGFKFRVDGVNNQLYVEGVANGVSKGRHLTINRDNGNVGIGTSNPLQKLHVVGKSLFDVGGNTRVTLGTTPYAVVVPSITGEATNGHTSSIEFTEAGLSLRGGPSTGGIEIDGSGRVGIMSAPTRYLTVGRGRGPGVADGWVTYSSRRWKKNIRPIHDALGKVKRLQGVEYDWKTNGKHDIGLIAEEVGAVIPEVVDYEDNGQDARALDYGRLVAILIEAIKAQQHEIEELKSELMLLKK